MNNHCYNRGLPLVIFVMLKIRLFSDWMYMQVEVLISRCLMIPQNESWCVDFSSTWSTLIMGKFINVPSSFPLSLMLKTETSWPWWFTFHLWTVALLQYLWVTSKKVVFSRPNYSGPGPKKNLKSWTENLADWKAGDPWFVVDNRMVIVGREHRITTFLYIKP